MPTIPNVFTPTAAERPRPSDNSARFTPSDGPSFDDYLSNATAASAPRNEGKSERREPSAKSGSAQGKAAPTTTEQQPARPEADPDEGPVVDSDPNAAGSNGETLPPPPICLAPPGPRPVQVDQPIAPPVQSKPQVEIPTLNPKQAAAANLGPGPLHPGPGTAQGPDEPTKPLDPPICTAGPDGAGEVQKVDGAVQTVKEPVAAVPDSMLPPTSDGTKPQAAAPATETVVEPAKPQKPEKKATNAPDARPVRIDGRAEKKSVERPSDVHAMTEVPEAADEPDDAAERGKVSGGQRVASRAPEGEKHATSAKSDVATVDRSKPAITDLKITAVDVGQGESVVGMNPAAEIGRFLVSAEPGTTTTSAVSSGSGGEGGAHSAVTANDASVVRSAGAASGDVKPIEDGDAGIERLAKVLSGSRGENNWRVALQLDPPEMGRVSIHARMADGGLSLNVAADSEPVRRMIESRIGELRDALTEHGIRLDGADVRVRATADTGQGTTRDAATNGQGESSARGFEQGQSSHRGDGGSPHSSSGFGQSYGGESRQSNSGWAGPMGLADMAATSETSVDLVA